MQTYIAKRPLSWAVVMASLVGVLVVTMAAFLLASATPAGADRPPPDHFHPPVVDVTLAAGESTTVNKELHLTGLPAAADIIVAIDTTGSMGTAINQAKADATNICNNVKAAIPGARFAVVDFEDYPGMPEGDAGDTAYTLLTPIGYVSDCTTFSAAIVTMVADGGGDFPEAYNRVFFEAYTDAVNPLVATRDPDATQFLVVLGDAEPHSALSFGACPAEPPSDFGRNNLSGGGDDLDTPTTIAGLVNNDIILLMIRYVNPLVSVSLACYEDLAAATGGDAVNSADAGTIDDFIIANAQATPYTVDLAVSGECPPVGLSFSPAPPYGPFSGPQNITFTETITAPATPGGYACTVNAVMEPGGPTTAVQEIIVAVTGCPPDGGDDDKDDDGLEDGDEDLLGTLPDDPDSDDDGIPDGNDDSDGDGEDDEDEDDGTDDECPRDSDGDGIDDEDEDDDDDDEDDD